MTKYFPVSKCSLGVRDGLVYSSVICIHATSDVAMGHEACNPVDVYQKFRTALSPTLILGGHQTQQEVYLIHNNHYHNNWNVCTVVGGPRRGMLCTRS